MTKCEHATKVELFAKDNFCSMPVIHCHCCSAIFENKPNLSYYQPTLESVINYCVDTADIDAFVADINSAFGLNLHKDARLDDKQKVAIEVYLGKWTE